MSNCTVYLFENRKTLSQLSFFGRIGEDVSVRFLNVGSNVVGLDQAGGLGHCVIETRINSCSLGDENEACVFSWCVPSHLKLAWSIKPLTALVISPHRLMTGQTPLFDLKSGKATR